MYMIITVGVIVVVRLRVQVTLIITTKLLLIQSDLVSLSLTIALPKALGSASVPVLRCLSGGALFLLSANNLDTGQCFHTATSHGPVAGTDARFWGGGTVVSSNPQGADRARGDHAK